MMIRRKREKILLTKSRNFTDVCMVGSKFKFRDFEELFNKYPEIHKGLKRVTHVQCASQDDGRRGWGLGHPRTSLVTLLCGIHMTMTKSTEKTGLSILKPKVKTELQQIKLH